MLTRSLYTYKSNCSFHSYKFHNQNFVETCATTSGRGIPGVWGHLACGNELARYRVKYRVVLSQGIIIQYILGVIQLFGDLTPHINTPSTPNMLSCLFCVHRWPVRAMHDNLKYVWNLSQMTIHTILDLNLPTNTQKRWKSSKVITLYVFNSLRV